VFTNLLLADEVNRTPPKTQAALLEAMEERQVSADGETHPLPDPFLVVATQNPIEYEGTYPLPEAQLDRFLMKVVVGYPDAAQEQRMLSLAAAASRRRRSTTSARRLGRGPARGARAGRRRDRRRRGRRLRRRARARDARAAERRAGREPPRRRAPARRVAGARRDRGPRVRHARRRRGGRRPVLRHRLVLRPEAELERYDAEAALRSALQTVPVPR
jgi:MoxR-like ATPase